MLCQHVHDSFQLGRASELAFHDLTDMKRDDTNDLLPHRHRVAQRETTCSFKPDAINILSRREENKEIVQLEAGGLYAGKFDMLPTTHASVIYDCAASTPTDAADCAKIVIRPKAPKLLTCAVLTVSKGKCVRLH